MQDGYVLSCEWMWQRGNVVVKPGTGSALFYINSWVVVFPSDHPADRKPKPKLTTAVSTVNIALKVDSSAVWHQIGRFTINLRSNISICVLIHTNTYYIPEYLLQYRPLGWDQNISWNILCLNTCPILTQSIPIHTRIHANTCMLGENQCAELKFNTCHYIPNTCQYIPIDTTIHARYMPILHWFSTQVFAQHTSIGMYPGMYWYVLCKYLACIM